MIRHIRERDDVSAPIAKKCMGSSISHRSSGGAHAPNPFSGARTEQWHNRVHAHSPKRRDEIYCTFIQYNQARPTHYRTGHS